MAKLVFPKECSNCGHLEPDGRCEICKPGTVKHVSPLLGEYTTADVPIPSTQQIIDALKVISYWQLSVPHGQIDLVEAMRNDLEAIVEESRKELRAKLKEMMQDDPHDLDCCVEPCPEHDLELNEE